MEVKTGPRRRGTLIQVEQLGKNRYKYRVRVGAGRNPVTGKHRPVNRTFIGTPTQAEEFRNALVAEVDRGEVVPGGGGRLNDVIQRWLALKAGEGIEASTQGNYRSTWMRLIEPGIGQLSLAKIDSKKLTDFFFELKTQGNSGYTITEAHKVLKGALLQAANDHSTPALAQAILLSKRPPNDPTEKKNEVETKTVQAIIRHAYTISFELGVFIELAVRTAARVGELVALEWEQIDFEKGELTIDRAAPTASVNSPLKTTKMRIVRRQKLSDETMNLLRQLQLHVETSTGTFLPHGYLFSRDGRGRIRWTKEYPRAKFGKIREALELDKSIKLKHFRNFSDSHLNAKFGAVTAGAVVGHSADVSAEQYARVLPEEHKNAVDYISDLIGTFDRGH